MSSSLKEPLIVPSSKQVSEVCSYPPISFSELLQITTTPAEFSVTLQGHRNSVNSVSISPDCQLIASGSLDFTIKIWSITNYKELYTLKGHSDEVWSVSFFHSKNNLASASKDSTIIIWNLNTFKIEYTLTGHEAGVQYLIISQNDEFILSGSDDCKLKVWNTEKKSLEFELNSHTESVKALALSHNGEFIASGSADKSIKLWDFQDKIEAFVLNCSGEVNTLAILPGDGFLVSGSDDGKVIVWSLETRSEDFVFSGHCEPVYSISLSVDGKTLVTGSADLLIKVINLEKRVEMFTLGNNSDAINSLQISPSNKFIIAGLADSQIQLYSLEHQNQSATLNPKTGMITSLAISSKSNLLLSATGEGDIIVWNLNTLHEEYRLSGHLGTATCILITKDTKWAISSSTDEQIKIWNLSERNEEFSLTGPESEICSLALSHDDKLLAASGEDLSITLWDWLKQDKKWVIGNCGNRYNNLAFSINDYSIFCPNEEHKILGLNTMNGNEEFILSGHSSIVLAVTVVPTGKFIISSDQEGEIRVWNIIEKKEYYTIKTRSGPVNSLDALFNGKWFVSGPSYKSIKIWNIEERRVEFSLKGVTYDVSTIKFSENGQNVIAGCSDGCVRIWEIGEKKEEFCLVGDIGGVKGIDITPDDRFCVSGSADNSVKVWNLIERNEDFPLGEHSAPVIRVLISPSGEFVATTSLDFTVKLWNFYEKSEINSFLCIKTCTALSFSSDSHTLIYAYDTKTVKIYNFSNESIQIESEFIDNDVFAIDFHSNGNYFLTAGQEQYIKVWSFPAYAQEFQIKSSNEIFEAKFSPNGEYIVSTEEYHIRIWNFFTRIPEFSLFLPTGSVNSLSFSPDSKYLVTGGQDSSLKIWNLSEKREEFSIQGHSKSIHSVISMHSGQFILSAGDDGLIKIWKMQNYLTPCKSVKIKSENEYYELNSSKFNTLKLLKSKKQVPVPAFKLKNLKPNNVIIEVKDTEHNFKLNEKDFYLCHALQVINKVALTRDLSKIIPESSDLNQIIWSPDSVLDPYFNPKALFLNFLHCLHNKSFSEFNADGIHLQVGPFLYTPVHIFADSGRSQEIQRFLGGKKDFVLKADVFGRSPMHYSIFNGHQECTDALIECILRMKQDSHCLFTSLFAAHKDFLDILRNSSLFLPALIDKFLIKSEKVRIQQGVQSSLYYFSDYVNPNIDGSQILGLKEANQAYFKYLPFRIPSVPYSHENIKLLEQIEKCENKKVFNKLLIQSVINYNYETTSFWAGLYAFFLLCNVISFLMAFQYGRTDYFLIILYAFFISILFIWEILQVFALGLYNYSKSTWNLIDFCKFPLSIYWILTQFSILESYEESTVLAFIILGTSLRCFKLFDSSRNLLNLFEFCLMNLQSFLTLFIYSTFCFSVLFAVAKNESLSFESLWSEIWSFNFSPKENYDDLMGNFWVKYSVIFIATVINVVFILNLLISVLGDYFQQFKVQKECLDYKEKLKISLNIQKSLYWKRSKSELKYFHILDNEPEHFEVCESRKLISKANGEEKLKDEISIKVNSIRNELGGKFQEMQEKVFGLEEKVNNVQDKIEGMELTLKKILETLIKSKN